MKEEKRRKKEKEREHCRQQHPLKALSIETIQTDASDTVTDGLAEVEGSEEGLFEIKTQTSLFPDSVIIWWQ